MSAIGSKPETGWTCWECGAANWPDARECWLCHRRDRLDWKSGATAVPTGRPATGRYEPAPRPKDPDERPAKDVAAVLNAVLVSVAAFVFATVVLPLAVIGFLAIALVVALNQFCSELARMH